MALGQAAYELSWKLGELVAIEMTWQDHQDFLEILDRPVIDWIEYINHQDRSRMKSVINHTAQYSRSTSSQSNMIDELQAKRNAEVIDHGDHWDPMYRYMRAIARRLRDYKTILILED